MANEKQSIIGLGYILCDSIIMKHGSQYTPVTLTHQPAI